MSAQAFSECLGSVFHVIYHYGVKLLHGLGFILHLLKSAISSCRQWVSRALTYDQQRRRRINLLQQENDQLRSKRMQLEREKLHYEKTLTKWYQPIKREDFNKLTSRRPANGARVSEESSNKKALQNFDNIITVLMEMAEDYLRDLLTGPQDRRAMRQHDSKKQYRVYGLLISAFGSQITGNIEKEKVCRQIVGKYIFVQINEAKIEAKCINPSVSLVHSMLTLIPPLLVIQPQWRDDDVQDTNRQTWDETSSKPLIYYRPVLVYGNQLHIAVKGLVGNSEKILQENDTSHQYLSKSPASKSKLTTVF